tara:strand:+ start:3437 stop:3670 length:234 start_codon:yes stop_codon:yes gene_type:complete
MSKGYEQFKKVDAELDKLLLYLEKLEEDYARTKNELNNQIGFTARYKNGFEILHEYFDSLSDDVKEDVDKQLRKLDL